MHKYFIFTFLLIINLTSSLFATQLKIVIMNKDMDPKSPGFSARHPSGKISLGEQNGKELKDYTLITAENYNNPAIKKAFSLPVPGHGWSYYDADTIKLVISYTTQAKPHKGKSVSFKFPFQQGAYTTSITLPWSPADVLNTFSLKLETMCLDDKANNIYPVIIGHDEKLVKNTEKISYFCKNLENDDYILYAHLTFENAQKSNHIHRHMLNLEVIPAHRAPKDNLSLNELEKAN